MTRKKTGISKYCFKQGFNEPGRVSQEKIEGFTINSTSESKRIKDDICDGICK